MTEQNLLNNSLNLDFSIRENQIKFIKQASGDIEKSPDQLSPYRNTDVQVFNLPTQQHRGSIGFQIDPLLIQDEILESQKQDMPGSVLMDQFKGSDTLNHQQDNSIILEQYNSSRRLAIPHYPRFKGYLDSKGSVLMSDQEFINDNLDKGSVFLQQGSFIMQEGSVIIEHQLGSIIMEQQGSIILNDNPQPLSRKVTVKMPVILEEDIVESKNIDAKQFKRVSQFEAILQKTLLPLFDPLELVVSNQMKLKSDRKMITVSMGGACFGRNETNNISFPDSTCVSGKHARVLFLNNRFHLQDLGSKRGTFLKVTQDFPIQTGMVIFVGDKFFCKPNNGEIEIILAKENESRRFKFQKGQNLIIGRDKKCNLCCEGTQFSLLSLRHMSITYQMNWRKNKPEFFLDDLNSRNGTYFRLSEKQTQSEIIQLTKSSKFNLAFEIFMEVVEVFYDS